MAVTVAGTVGYDLGGSTNTDPKTTTMPTGLADGDVLALQVNIGSGASTRLESVLTINGVTVDAATRRWAGQFAGYSSFLYSVPVTAAMSGTTLSFITGGTATRPPTMAGVVLRGTTGEPVATPSHVSVTSTGATSITTPAQSGGQDAVVEVSFVQDAESDAAPGTKLWTPPTGITASRSAYSASTTIPIMSAAVGVDLTVKTTGQGMGSRTWTKDNAAFGGGWTVQYGVAPTEVIPSAGLVSATAYNDPTLRITYNVPVPTSATAGRRVLTALTFASGSRLLAASLTHADATTRTLTELAPKAALTNGGHACYVVEFEADAKTAGSTLVLTQSRADGSTTDGLRASIPLVVVEGVGVPVGATVGHSSASTTKTTPQVRPGEMDMVELTVASDSKGGAAPITTTSAWTAPEGFTLAVADYQAGTTNSPASTSAIAHRFGVRLSTGSAAGGRQWLSNVANVGATWTVLYPPLAGSTASGLLAVVEGGLVPLEVVFPDTLSTPGTPALASPATNITGTGFTSSWSTASSASDYLVQRRTGTNPFATVATVTTTTFAHTGLALSTAYDVRVIARNGPVEGTASNVVSTTTAAA